jgi:hypothetical protein
MIVCIVDSSVLCELLSVQDKSSKEAHERALSDFEVKRSGGHTFLLPIAAILETGNHIAHGKDGGRRRKEAEKFAALVRDAIDGNSPFTPSPAPQVGDIGRWLDEIVNDASRGLGIGDRSLIDTWAQQKAIHPHGRVYVWSSDDHLRAYDTDP